jgi:hypothetical protein
MARPSPTPCRVCYRLCTASGRASRPASARIASGAMARCFSLAPFCPRPQSFQTLLRPKKACQLGTPRFPKTLGFLQNLGVPPKPWGPSKTLGSLQNLGVPPRGRAGAASRAAPARAWPAPGQRTPPARWGPLPRPAGAARALRAPPVAPKFTYINSLTSGKKL